MKRVFLGGTCNGSKWRDKLIPQLTISYFNPVVENWDEAAYKRELHERDVCDICLYVLTPVSDSPYSIAEIVDDSNKRPHKTVFCFIQVDEHAELSAHALKAYSKIGLMVEANGGTYIRRFSELAEYLNK